MNELRLNGPMLQDCGLAGAWVVKQAQLLGSIFTDFSGRRFKFSGEDAESYNLFTEADHQLNAIVSNGSPHARQLGITLRGVGIHGPDTHVKIAISAEGLLSCEPSFSFSCILCPFNVNCAYLTICHLWSQDSAILKEGGSCQEWCPKSTTP